MTYETNIHEDVSLVRLSGDADLASAGALSLLEKRLTGQSNIVVDVAGLDNVDATFLRFLIRLKEHADKDQPTTIELIGVKPKLRRKLEVTGLTRMFAFS